MAEYLVTDVELTSIANAIRTKAETSAQLEFPDGFIDAIADISGGGGTIIENVVGAPTVVTLEAANWNGTTNTVTVDGDQYANADVNALQIGIPPTSSASNADAVIAAGITLPQTGKNANYQKTVDDGNGGTTTVTTTQITLVFSAIYVPSVDVRISVYGLV